MADHPVSDEPKPTESLLDKIQDKIYGHDSSSSDSDSHKPHTTKSEPSINNKIWRLFGREKHVHQVFGGGRPADVFLWRNKKISAGVLVGATAVWVIFELLEYNLVGLVCNCLMLTLAILFLWSNATHLINKSPPNINKVEIPEDLTVDVALSLRYEVNRGFALLREISLERDLKKFLVAIVGLWLFSVVGSCCSFLTLLYITFVLLHTVPVLYEKYEDKVDPFAEKATAEIKKHYAVVHAKYLSKIPRAPLKAKKLH